MFSFYLKCFDPNIISSHLCEINDNVFILKKKKKKSFRSIDLDSMLYSCCMLGIPSGMLVENLKLFFEPYWCEIFKILIFTNQVDPLTNFKVNTKTALIFFRNKVCFCLIFVCFYNLFYEFMYIGL